MTPHNLFIISFDSLFSWGMLDEKEKKYIGWSNIRGFDTCDFCWILTAGYT